MTEKSMLKADLITSIVLLVFGIGIVAISRAMPTMADQNQTIYSAPGIVPGFIGLMLVLLSFAMLLRSLKRKALAEFRAGTAVKDALSQESTRRILATIVLCVLYAFLLGKLWFPIPTFLFIFGFIVLFEYDLKTAFASQFKKVAVAVLIALLTTTAVVLVFQKLFLVNLP